MSKKIYAFVGNWGFAPSPKGITSFSYKPENGDLELIETIRPDIAAGQLCIDAENRILYVVDECGERRGEIGGGGYVLAFKIDEKTGKLELMNRKESLSPEPSYLCMSKNKKYLVACHCADPFHVTKIVKNEDGSFENEVLFDDTALVMFPILADGSLGEPCDVFITEGLGGKDSQSRYCVDPVTNHIQLIKVISRLHAVIPSPNGEVYVTCDKGMDRLISFRIDEEQGKFVPLDEYTTDEVGCFPRYGAFHPHLPVFYANNENLALLNCFHYDNNGKLELMAKLPLLEEEVGLIDGKPVGAQDILVHPNGKTLYITLCGLNDIVVVALDEEGKPSLKQKINSEGILPRGICLSPDERFLLSGNMVSGDITSFRVLADGTLQYTRNKYEAVSPSAIKFLTVTSFCL